MLALLPLLPTRQVVGGRVSARRLKFEATVGGEHRITLPLLCAAIQIGEGDSNLLLLSLLRDEIPAWPVRCFLPFLMDTEPPTSEGILGIGHTRILGGTTGRAPQRRKEAHSHTPK